MFIHIIYECQNTYIHYIRKYICASIYLKDMTANLIGASAVKLYINILYINMCIHGYKYPYYHSSSLLT
jgi:hypothetical protein